MKTLATLILLSAFAMPVVAADAPPAEKKKVCIDQKDAKTGKVKEVCKTVKVHKKHDATKVPEPTKKK